MSELEEFIEELKNIIEERSDPGPGAHRTNSGWHEDTAYTILYMAEGYIKPKQR